MQIQYPSGFKPYGSISPAWQSADGYYYWGMIGTGYQGFMYYVFRQKEGQRAEYVPYSPQVHHGNLALNDKGLELSGYFQFGTADQVNTYTGIRIQGFVKFNDSTPRNYPTTIVQHLEGVDGVARGRITDLTQTVNDRGKRLDALHKQVQDHLTNHPSAPAPSQPGLTAQQVADIVWSKVGDRLYDEIGNPNNPNSALNNANHYLSQVIEKYDTVGSGGGLTEAQVNAIVTQKVNDAVNVAINNLRANIITDILNTLKVESKLVR